MKKALVVFLILAVAGGLFAQTVTVGGNVQTGIGIGFTDADEGGDAKVDFVRNRGEHGMRGDISLKFSSAADAAYGPYGATVGVRVREGLFSGSALVPLYVEANLFWQPVSLLWLQIGSGGGAGWGTMGGIDRSLDLVDANGLKDRLPPIPGLDIVAHARYGGDAITGNLVKNMNYIFGARYTAPGLVSVLANARYYAENKDDKTEKIRFGAGANFLGLSGLGLTKLAADVGTWYLGTDDFFLGIGEAVGFATGGLTLGVKAQQFIWMGEGSKDVMPMLFQADVSYKINSTVTAGIEGRYKIGAKPSFNYRNAGESGGVDTVAAFSAKDVAGLAISPQLTFNVGPTINLGYNLQMDMTKDAKPAGEAYTMQHLIYGTVAISF
jgi:hypothetical protein